MRSRSPSTRAGPRRTRPPTCRSPSRPAIPSRSPTRRRRTPSTVDVGDEPPDPEDEALALHSLRDDLTDEVFYFVLPDRFDNGGAANDTGGLTGDRLTTGFDPTDKGYYHGGDFAGLRDRLDYIESLGTTAIWMAPIFKNRPVQGDGADAFRPATTATGSPTSPRSTRISARTRSSRRSRRRRPRPRHQGLLRHHHQPHRGRDRVRRTDTTSYRNKASYPYKDAERQRSSTTATTPARTRFPPLDPASASRTYRSSAGRRGERQGPGLAERPDEYHNRGDSSSVGENSQYGDFFGLDDLFTEQPEVVDGMTDIYKTWVTDFGIDGFRIDTVKHVNMEFWQKFGPAIQAYASGQRQADDFFMYGEVFDSDPAFMSQYTTAGKLPATLDFGFQSRATSFAPARPRPTRWRPVRQGRLLHRRRQQRLQPADLPRATTTWAGSAASYTTARHPAPPTPMLLRARQAGPRADVFRARHAGRSTMATSRASPATAATRTRART